MGYEIADTKMIGSVGTLVAAGLETAGHHLQAEFLKILDAGLASDLGALLYVISVISALVCIAVGGRYKFGAWLLIGPALYWWVISTRVESYGAKWVFGDRQHSTEMVFKSVEGVADGKSQIANNSSKESDKNELKPVKVAQVFAIWNNFVSSLMRGLTSALYLTDVKSDVSFVQRAERYVKLFNLKVEDPEVEKFLKLITLGPKCVEYYGLQQALYIGARTEHENEAIRAKLKQIDSQVTITRQDENYPIIEELYKGNYFGEGVKELKEAYVCRDLWDLAILALKNEANKLVSRVADAGRVQGLEQKDVLKDLGKKFNPNGELCNYKDEMGNEASLSEQECSDQQVLIMVNAIAVKLFMESAKEINPSLAQLSLSRHLRIESDKHPYNKMYPNDPGKKDHFDVSRDLRHLAPGYEYVGKGEYLSAVLALPYLQGIVLYFLSLSFPFFSFALIIPGRHRTFFTWMALWFWAKSWDFGYAVVMIIDELLYALLPHGPQLVGDKLSNPGEAFQMVLAADPTYSVQIYYNIMATLILGVPALTGMFVKRAGGEILDAVNNGFSQFSGNIGYAMSSFYRSARVQEISAQAQKSISRAAHNSMASAILDGEVLTSLGVSAATKSKLFDDLAKRSKNQGATFQSAVASAFSELGKTASEYGKQRATAKIQYNMANSAWEASMSRANMERSQLAVMLKYSNHDFNDDFPTGALIDLVLARRNYQWGGAVRKVVDRQIDNQFDGGFKQGLDNGKGVWAWILDRFR
ncbi:MAG: hypothetical protein IT291_05280 [Deltaproteobacteria bacterium]|nr:hypothetical protein [Deltaproteobacteria bacterium]